MGITYSVIRCVVLAFLLALAGGRQTMAAGPIETSIFAVQGVEVDVTDTDAATAKNKALIQVQITGFKMLAQKLGTAAIVEAVEKMNEKEVLTYLRSLSIEEESISPGRYKGKLTVRFLPDRVKSLYSRFGVRVVSSQGPSFLILPVWKTAEGYQLWEDNPWRKAWLSLRAEQSQVPILVPLGDFDDSEMISASDAVSGDEIKLEAIRRRYDAKSVMVTVAEAMEDGGVKAQMSGNSALGKITFDKTYRDESGDVLKSAQLATQRFHSVMVEKYRSGAGPQVAAKTPEEIAKAGEESSRKRQALSVAVPFGGPSEWNRLRSRILSAPGVVGLDVASLGGDGAVIRLTIVGGVDAIQDKMEDVGLQMTRAGGSWVIQPL